MQSHNGTALQHCKRSTVSAGAEGSTEGKASSTHNVQAVCSADDGVMMASAGGVGGGGG